MCSSRCRLAEVLRLAGDGAIVKPLAALTVRPMVAVPLRLPEVPVMVTVEAPGTAVTPAVNVSVLAVVAVAGLKEAVTPAGSPDAARATVPAKPFCRLMVMVPALDPPGVRLKLAGVAESVNAGDAVMVSDTRAVLVRLPEVPVMVSVDVAAAAELLAISVSVLVVMALAGLNDAVTPAGNPAMARFTALLKPCCALTVMLLVPLAPAAMESVDADDDRLNAGAFDAPVKLLIKGWPAGRAPSGSQIVAGQRGEAAVVAGDDVVQIGSLSSNRRRCRRCSGLMKPTRAFLFAAACWFASARKPAHKGAAALVPPTSTPCPLLQIRNIWTSAMSATSGMLRMVADPPAAVMVAGVLISSGSAT